MKNEFLVEIDGSFGEGGGQILRSALALSMVTGKSLRLVNIRQRRSPPGLKRQHLTAVQAAKRISDAQVVGDHVGSTQLTFEPREIVAGEHHFAIGTAGSTTLVLQTILPALVCASSPSTITLEGGTHNPLAPPFEFLVKAYLPLLERMGPRITAKMERYGFYPRGGGKITARIEPVSHLTPLHLLERGPVVSQSALAIVSDLPVEIGERELNVVARELGWPRSELAIKRLERCGGPGNVLLLEVASQNVTEVFVSFGEKGVRAEEVARRAVREVRAYLNHDVAVGEFLADQLLLPMVLAGGGSFTTVSPLSSHAETQRVLLGQFLDVSISVRESPEATKVTVGPS